MRNISRRASLALAAIVAYLSSTAYADNLLVNPAFESGNTGFITGYTYGTFIDSAGKYTINANAANVFGATSAFPDHTTGTGLMALFNGSTVANTVAWQQTVTVTPGTIYEFSGWIATPDRSGTFNENAIDLHPADTAFKINGLQIGTFALPSPSPTGTWGKFTAQWNSGAATSATIQLFLTRTETSGNDIALDDLSFTAVPEPGSLAALGVGAVFMIRRRKR